MRTTSTLAAWAFVLLAGCEGDREGTAGSDTAANVGESATTGAAVSPTGDAPLTAPMRDANGRDLGTVTLTASGEGFAVAGALRGLPPGEHAIHVHMTGRCDAPSFESAGDHWNPTNRQHGTQNPQGPHLGDLPNLTVAGDSSVSVQVTAPGGSLRGTNGLTDGDGAAVIVHTRADDYRTDPSGNAGGRIACGVVSGS